VCVYVEIGAIPDIDMIGIDIDIDIPTDGR
jgi:hypothetical protein